MMQPPFASNLPSSTPVSRLNPFCSGVVVNRVSLDTGLYFRGISDCRHSNALSGAGTCYCNYCNFLLRLFNFHKKYKCQLTRSNIKSLCGLNFTNIFSVACGLSKIVPKNILTYKNAASLINNRLSCQYDCSFPVHTGTNPEAPSHPNCWHICNDAQHLFECLGARDQARREYFPVLTEGYYWHATCSNCGASCAYSSPRENVILVLFFSNLLVKYCGDKYYASLCSDEDWVHISKSMAVLILSVKGMAVDFDGLEIKNQDPNYVNVRSSVPITSTQNDNYVYGGDLCERFAKDCDVLKDYTECEHTFFLTSTSGFQLKLTPQMMRILLMLMPCHGYIVGCPNDNSMEYCNSNDRRGLVSVGGLVGVNMRTNFEFDFLHKSFYEGGFRHPNGASMDDIVIHYAPVNTQAQSSSDDCYSDDNPLQDSYDYNEVIASIQNSDKDFLSIEELTESRTSTRGIGLSLKKRVGGLLKGVTNCVTKLHAVWDWPLDKAVDVINGVGGWLEDNKANISSTILSCQACPELQYELSRIIAEQEKVNEIMRTTMKKMAETLDSVTRMNAKNIDAIEKRLDSLDNQSGGSDDLVKLTAKFDKMKADLENIKAEVQPTAGESLTDVMSKFDSVKDLLAKFSNRLKKLEQHEPSSANLDRVEVKIDNLKESIENVKNRVSDLEKQPKRPSGRVRPTTDLPGEQMAIPKLVADEEVKFNASQPIVKYGRYGRVPADLPFEFNTKRGSVINAQPQSGQTTFEAETIQHEIVESSFIKSTGPSEEHNIMLAKIYLGNVSWKVSSGEGSVIGNFTLPDDIWSRDERVRNIVSCFQYYSCDGLKFYITTTSVPTQGGTLIFAWDAMSSATNQKIDSVLQLSNLPFAFVHASECINQCIEIDSPSIQHIMCTSASEGSIGALGTLKIGVVNVLNAAIETSQAVSLNIFVQFRNPKLSFRTVPHSIVSSQSDGIATDTLSNLDQIDGLESIIYMGKWTTTSSTNLCELTVHPTACSVTDGLVTQTNLSVISSLFNRWSGPLRYRIVFGASLFVKGKIVVSAIPVAFRESKLSLDEITSFPCTICDLTGADREFELSVPYISIGRSSIVSRDSLYDTSSYNCDMVVSRLHFVIMDPLVMNANASNSVSFCVTVGPDKGFHLSQLSGVKAEFVDRSLKQSFGTTLTCGALVGGGFKRWCSIPSVLNKFTIGANKHNALHLMVAPCYRNIPPCTTSLSWLAQLFIQWSGSLTYTLRCHSDRRVESSFIRVWYDSNGSTQTGEEMEFLSDVDPPSGAMVHYWYPSLSPVIEITIPFCARSPKLMLPKSRYEPGPYDWVNFYNGSVVIDYEGKNDAIVEMSISGGDDFEMFEQTVPPRCGKVSKAYTVLSYNAKLMDISKYATQDARLSGPTNKAIIVPVPFDPKEAVDKGKGKVEPTRKKSLPHEGQMSLSESGEPVIFVNGAWEFYEGAQSQMGCFSSLKEVNNTVKMLEERETCSKIADMVDKGHDLTTRDSDKLSKLFEAANKLVPLLDTAKRVMGNLEDKLGELDSYKSKIMSVLKGFIKDSVPGMVAVAIENEQYLWATLITIFGGASLIWVCKSKKSYTKRLSTLCMIVWAPFITKSIWQLGKWIKEFVAKQFKSKLINMTKDSCRKLSWADTFEGAKNTFGNFTEWFVSNWAVAVQNLLSVLGVVASLVVWGTIPDEKKLDSFSAKFKSIGDKGRNFSNTFNGFNAITKVCGEWSKRIVGWIMSLSGSSLPKADSALQKILDFDLKDWVKDTRKMALQENRFTDFGADDHLIKVRHLYDRSRAIELAMIDGCKVDAQLAFIIKECKDKCNELMNETYTFKGMKKPRIDPIHVSMLGAPGVGKSTITHIVINNLLDHRGEPEVDRIFTRCCADAYWSNYHQEPVILYDDLGAIKSNQKLSDYAEIMGVKTNDPFSVPMAGVDDKGKHCTSRYVFSCTNHLELDDSGDVTSKLAYYRRRNVLVQVTRDTSVIRDEENPTKGLLFTVLGYSLQGAQSDKVTFGVKTVWDESFLSDVDTSDWIFENVEYETFLRFLCIYTDAYMKSQEKLLSGIKNFKCDPFKSENNIVFEAQANLEVTTLGDMIVQFDKEPKTGSDFAKLFKGTSFLPPDKWHGKQQMCFKDLLKAVCGCGIGKECCYDLHFKRLANLVATREVHNFFFLERVRNNPEDTTIVIKNSNWLKELDIKAIFIVLASYYRFSFKNDMCYYHYLNSINSIKEKLFFEVDYDDRIPNSTNTNGVYVWTSAHRLFPILSKRVGFIPIFTGKMHLIHCGSNKVNTNDAMLEWKGIWDKGFESNLDPFLLLPNDCRDVIKCIVNGIESFGSHDNYSEEVKDAINQVECIYGEGSILFTFCLILAHEKSRRLEIIVKESEIKMKTNSFKAKERFAEYEKQLVPKLSKQAKIAIAIGAGVVAAGAIAGLAFAVKALFGFFGNEVNEEDESYEKEDADPEMSGAHASNFYTTRFLSKGGLKPRVVVKTVDGQASGAHESGMYNTHFIKRDKKPIVARALPEGGFGACYDETTNKMVGRLNIERRRKLRSQYSSVVKHASTGKGPKPLALKNIDNWQGQLIKRGFHNPDRSLYLPIVHINKSNTIMGDSQKPLGEFTVNDPSFELDHDILETIEGLFTSMNTTREKLAKEGTFNMVHKQASVGDHGLNRDVNMVKILTDVVSTMSCTILRKRDSEWKSFNVLRLMGCYVLAPAHYFEEIDEGDKLYFVSMHKVVEFPFVPSHISLVSDIQEIVVWYLGKHVPPSPDFSKHIPTAEDWKHYTTVSGAMSLTNYGQSIAMQFVHGLTAIEMTKADVEVPTACYSVYGTQHIITAGLRYRVHCMPGFCGAAIVRADTRAVKKIIGMHVAGERQRGVGYAEILTYEPIMNAVKKIEGSINICVSPSRVQPELCEKQSTLFVDKGNLGLIGQVIPQALPNIPTKTSIAKSRIHGLICGGVVKSEPSILSKWDKRLGEKRTTWDPVLEAVKKYGVTTSPFPPSEIKEVEDHLCDFFSNRENTLQKREVNDLEVGINGIDLSDFWSPIEMKTSSGYPYVLQKPSGASGKGWMFELDGDYPSGRPKFTMKHPDLIASFNNMHNQIREGVIPNIVTMECPKDERRKLSKIYDTPATRTFTILPPEINILFRMYFGDFAAMVMTTRSEHFSQVGINPETLEWSELMNSLLKKGKRGFAGDYAKFDGIGSPEIYHSIVNIVNSWYCDGPTNARARHCLINSIVHRDGIAGDLFLRYSQGMPSGFSMTVIFNSFVNYYYMGLAWMNIVTNSSMSPQSDLGSFDYFCKIIVYGDDNVVSVSDEFLDIYNLKSVASYLSSYGVTYTDDAKNPIHLSEPYVDITSVTFLKRSFIKVDKSGFIWKAPLDKSSITERCNWIRECEEPERALYENIDSALFEASIHSEGYFNELKDDLNQALNRVMLPLVADTYKKCQNRWWSNMTNAAFAQPDLTSLVELAGKNQINLTYKYKDVLLDKKVTLLDALKNAKSSPLIYYSV